ncbi:MAG TPA: MaoC family dehydratase N-terminal domain-containing protein [Candidatus Binataceae bacterium]|nr:MaoC family dehydratase N-terminal domain-containing protein [Candidatus Binataceae bacterium]
MPCDSRIVGEKLGPFEYDVDQFWAMAYAAGLSDANPRYVDSLRSGALIAHPVFSVCLATRARWQMEPLFLEAGLTHDESIRSVHVTQDMIIHRAIKPPERLAVIATVAAMERRKAGTYLLSRYEIIDANGAPVATIHWGRIWRGVGMTGPDRVAGGTPEPPSMPQGDPRNTFRIELPATAAIIYTACARADNPVNFHTDTAAAQRSGLPAPILMGVATLGISVSKIIEAEAAGDPERVTRVYANFGAMVFMPSAVTLRVTAREHRQGGDEAVGFELINAEGGRAIRRGVVILRC